jgi:hypothetical protein
MPAKARHNPHEYGLALTCLTLILALFGAMAVAAETGQPEWLIAVSAADFAAILWFALRTPKRLD